MTKPTNQNCMTFLHAAWKHAGFFFEKNPENSGCMCETILLNFPTAWKNYGSISLRFEKRDVKFAFEPERPFYIQPFHFQGVLCYFFKRTHAQFLKLKLAH